MGFLVDLQRRALDEGCSHREAGHVPLGFLALKPHPLGLFVVDLRHCAVPYMMTTLTLKLVPCHSTTRFMLLPWLTNMALIWV